MINDSTNPSSSLITERLKDGNASYVVLFLLQISFLLLFLRDNKEIKDNNEIKFKKNISSKEN